MAEFKRRLETEAVPTDKASTIAASKLPESHKLAYLKQIGAVQEPSDEGKVGFSVYARLKKIDGSLHKAMLAYPKAKGISVATLVEWDEVFKKF